MSMDTQSGSMRVHEGRGVGQIRTVDEKEVVSRIPGLSRRQSLFLVEEVTDTVSLQEEGGRPPSSAKKRETLPQTGDISVEVRGRDILVVLIPRYVSGVAPKDPPPETGEVSRLKR